MKELRKKMKELKQIKEKAKEEFLRNMEAAQQEFEKEMEETEVLQQKADEAKVIEREILQLLKQNQVDSGFGKNIFPTTQNEKKEDAVSNSGTQTPRSGEMPK